MDILKAEKMARDLLSLHGFDYCLFAWTRSHNVFGTAVSNRVYANKKTLKLSKPLVLVNDEDRVRDTILHEIAHFIAGAERGHDWRWKQVCREIGAKPERCFSSLDTVMAQAKYTLACGNCGLKSPRSRIPKNTLVCALCCKKYNRGRYTEAYKLELITN